MGLFTRIRTWFSGPSPAEDILLKSSEDGSVADAAHHTSHDRSDGEGKMKESDFCVVVYSLSTCSHCKATKRLLGECSVEFEFTDVDLLEKEEREQILDDLRKLNPRCSFPTIKINETVIVGYREDQIREALGFS